MIDERIEEVKEERSEIVGIINRMSPEEKQDSRIHLRMLNLRLEVLAVELRGLKELKEITYA